MTKGITNILDETFNIIILEKKFSLLRELYDIAKQDEDKKLTYSFYQLIQRAHRSYFESRQTWAIHELEHETGIAPEISQKEFNEAVEPYLSEGWIDMYVEMSKSLHQEAPEDLIQKGYETCLESLLEDEPMNDDWNPWHKENLRQYASLFNYGRIEPDEDRVLDVVIDLLKHESFEEIKFIRKFSTIYLKSTDDDVVDIYVEYWLEGNSEACAYIKSLVDGKIELPYGAVQTKLGELIKELHFDAIKKLIKREKIRPEQTLFSSKCEELRASKDHNRYDKILQLMGATQMKPEFPQHTVKSEYDKFIEYQDNEGMLKWHQITGERPPISDSDIRKTLGEQIQTKGAEILYETIVNLQQLIDS